MQEQEALNGTDYHFPGQLKKYTGKVRDVYTLESGLLVMIATDRISAFDCILPRAIPYKGQVLNRVAGEFLRKTEDILPNWLIATPHPNVAIGLKCEPYKIEMVIRGYLAGHAWREYKAGKRTLCGVTMPEGLKENDRFPQPIITPSTKADEGHDEDISKEEIIEQGLVPREEYEQLEAYTRLLFKRGTEMAKDRGLILVDTKYEFGKFADRIHLMDEIHTPDSSRYFYAEGYEERQRNGEKQRQLSKEFVREWLIQKGFQGKEGQEMPEMNDDWVQQISARYIELYERITGVLFERLTSQNTSDQIERSVNETLLKMQ
jgi:phosphoribosylaminoimidazole-succinocarboxamide synthase